MEENVLNEISLLLKLIPGFEHFYENHARNLSESDQIDHGYQILNVEKVIVIIAEVEFPDNNENDKSEDVY